MKPAILKWICCDDHRRAIGSVVDVIEFVNTKNLHCTICDKYYPIAKSAYIKCREDYGYVAVAWLQFLPDLDAKEEMELDRELEHHV